MSFFENLRSRMNGGQQSNTPQGQQQPQGQGNQGQQPDNNNLQQSQSSPGGTNGGISNNPASYLDAYKDLYTPQQATSEAPEFNLDSEKLNGVVNSQDFMQGIDPSAMQKLQSGDMSALGDIINHATRNAYKAALTHGSTLTGKYVGARFDHADKGLDGKIKSSQLQDHLSRTPNFSNPVVKQQMTDIVQRLSQKHPDAPYEDVVNEAKRILTEVAGAVNPESPQNKPQVKEQDWEAFMSQ